MQLQIRRFKTKDAPAAAALIARTLLTSNQGDYPKAYLDRLITQMTPAWLCQKAAATHFYVGYFQQQLVATGAIGSYWGRPGEYSLFTIFVDPEVQGMGGGRQILHTLEQDVYFSHAHRVEIPASVTAHLFYQHFGYRPKPGGIYPDDEGLYRLEKFPHESFY